MREYWIETDCFAAPLGSFTSEQYDIFVKSCNRRENRINLSVIRPKRPVFMVLDYAQIWDEEVESNIGSKVENFWSAVEGAYMSLLEDYPTCKMFVKIYPEDAVKDDPEDEFLVKRIRYHKTKDQGKASLRKNSDLEVEDWNLLAVA